MAAEVLAQGGARVTVYDAMPSAGRKFLMAGRGGLNLTHSEPLPAVSGALSRGDAAACSRAIEAFPPDALRDWSEALGQPTFVGSSGRVFPKAFKASPLLRAWLRRLDASGRAVRVAPSLDWLGRARPPAVSNAGRPARRRARATGAGARRRKLAAARLGWRMGGNARREGRDDIAAQAGQLRLHRRLVGYLSRSLRGPAAQGRCADVRAAQPCAARRSSPAPASKAARSMRCRLSCARPSSAQGEATLQVALRPDLEIEDLIARLSAPKGKQTLSNFLRKAAQPLAGRHRPAAGGGKGIRRVAVVAVASQTSPP